VQIAPLHPEGGTGSAGAPAARGMRDLTNVDLGHHQRICMEEAAAAAARRKTEMEAAAAAGYYTRPLFSSA